MTCQQFDGIHPTLILLFLYASLCLKSLAVSLCRSSLDIGMVPRFLLRNSED